MISPEHHWNNKHPKVPQVYSGRYIPKHKHVVEMDIRRFVWANDVVLSNVLSDEIIPAFDPDERSSDDDMAWCIQRWVCNGKRTQGRRKGRRVAKYVRDKKARGYNEYWLFPVESLELGNMDCEDGAYLIASLMLVAGIPEWRVRVAAGWVQTGGGAEQGGHAYCCYCRESDNNWVALDWCYLEDPETPVPDKPKLHDRKEYKEVWFSGNSRFSWSHTHFGLVGRIQDYKAPGVLKDEQ